MYNYHRPVEISWHEIEIKRSRFIAYAIPLINISQLHQQQAQLRVEHSRASHHCLAYILGPPKQPTSAGSSDDGEPSGTAGKPMLNVLLQQEIGDVGVVVTRYFGGTKLGAGGLVRAYSQSVSELVKLMQLQLVESKRVVKFTYPYSLEPQINRLIKPANASIITESFGESIVKELSLADSMYDELIASLRGLAYLGVVVLSQDPKP